MIILRRNCIILVLCLLYSSLPILGNRVSYASHGEDLPSDSGDHQDTAFYSLLEATKLLNAHIALELTNYRKAGTEQDKTALKEKILAIAETRQENWREAIEFHSKHVAEHVSSLALAPGLRQQLLQYLPELAFVLEEMEIEEHGELSVYGVLLHPDYIGKRATTRYRLNNGTQDYQLHIPEKVAEKLHLAHGMQVRIRRATKVWGQDTEHLILPSDDNSSTLQVISTPAAQATVTGTRSMLVILFNFQDNSITPNSPAEIHAAMFTSPQSLKQFFLESSYNQLTFSGDVAGWYTLPFNSNGTCPEMTTWTTAANAAAQAQGYNLANYQHIAYFFPENNPATGVQTSCGYGGLGEMPGNQVWINANVRSSTNQFDLLSQGSVTSHEIGHNLGVHHANYLNCGSASVLAQGSCANIEYGDNSDVMGSGGFKQFNAPHKLALGWLLPTDVQTVTSNGTYTIYALESLLGYPRALKLTKPDTNESYYVSYRVTSGTFDVFNNPGAFVHAWNDSPTTQTKVLRGNPLNSLFSLQDNQRFEDQINNLTITQTSHSINSVTVTVNYGPITCIRSTPSFSISPASMSFNAGWSRDLSLTMTNSDSIACSPSTLSLNSTLPSGWTQTPAIVSQLMSPYQQFALPLSIRPPNTASVGNYSLLFSLTSSTGLSPSPTTVAATIYASDVTPPSTPTGLTAVADPTGVTLTWNPSTDNGTISFYRIRRVDVLTSASVSTDVTELSYRDTTTTIGRTYRYTLTATDSSNRTSLTSNSAEVKIPLEGSDSITPRIQMIAPAQGSTISGVTTVEAVASDNQAVSRVEFILDTYTIIEQFTVPPYRFQLDTNLLLNGSHQLAARAFDFAGNYSRVSVTLSTMNNAVDTGSPSVSFISPASNSTVSGTVNISVNPSDDHAIASVTLYVDDNIVRVWTMPPYAHPWDSRLSANGSHRLQATVRDFAGHATARGINVNVSNSGPAPLRILSSIPSSGYVDPLEDQDPEASFTPIGTRDVFITFSAPVMRAGGGVLIPDNFQRTYFRDNDGDGDLENVGSAPDLELSSAPSLSVSGSGAGPYRLTFNPRLPVGAWTEIKVVSVTGTNGAPFSPTEDKIILGALPMDLTQDGTVSPDDGSRFLQIINNLYDPWPLTKLDFCDQRRDGELAPEDIIRAMQLSTGLGTLQQWSGFSMGPRP